MGRGKVELKRIEDKGSRQVSFFKRKNGLMKKAHELAVLCDVDVALFVFSGRNRLFEFSTGESMIKILTRYQNYKNADETVRRSVRENLASEYRDVWTADELAQLIERHIDEQKVQLSDVTKLCQLEKEIQSVLQLVKTRKTQVLMEEMKTLQEKQKQLTKDKQLMMGEIMAARLNETNVDG